MGQMNRKMLSLILVAMMMFVAACSSNVSENNNQGGAVSDQEGSGKAPSKLTALVDNNFTPYMQKIGAEFEKEFGVPVEVITTDYNSLHNKLVTSLASGDKNLDIFQLDTVWPQEFSDAGFIEPVDSYLPSDIRENLTVAYEQFIVDDQLVGLPADDEMKFMYYNEKMLKDGGFDAPPKTWDELVEMSKSLMDQGIATYGIAFGWKQAEGLLCDYTVYVNAFGGEFQDGNGNWVFNEGGGLEALEFMVSMLKGSNIADPASTTLDDGTLLNTFTGGGIPFMTNWSFAVSALKDNPDIKMALIPGVDGVSESSTVTGGAGIAMSKFSENKEWAGKLLNYMNDKRSEIVISELVGGLPPYKDMATSPVLQEKYASLDVMTKQLDYKMIRPKVAAYTDFSHIMQVAVSQALMGEKSPKQALDDAKKELEDSGVK